MNLFSNGGATSGGNDPSTLFTNLMNARIDNSPKLSREDLLK
jgi:hypothetical protein